MAGKRVCVGVIVGPHGVKGEVKVKSFTEKPEDFAAYGPLSDETGERKLDMAVTGRLKGTVIAKVAGVHDRDAAEKLRGVRLFVPRAALPKLAADEFYYSDLVGLAAELSDGTPLGKVVAVYNFGAGDVIEVKPPRGALIDLPFTHATVPVVDLAGGRIVVEPPVGLLEKPSMPRSRPAKRRPRRAHARG